MAASYDVPEAVLERLRCSLCKNVLSCGPIYSTDEGNVCRSCKSRKLTYAQNVILEELLIEARFPCVNLEYGCEEGFVFNLEKEHEDVCQYMPIACPSSGGCKWRGTGHNIAEHFKATHAGHFLHSNLSFSTGLDGNEQCNYLAEISSGVESINVPILIQYCCDGDILFLDVMYFRDGFLKDISYQLTLTNAQNKSVSMALQSVRCEKYVRRDIKGSPAKKVSLKNLLQNHREIVLRFTFEANSLQLSKIKTGRHLKHCCRGEDICRKCCLSATAEPNDVPEAVLMHLKCSECKKYLSCGPIRISYKNKIATFCGRSSCSPGGSHSVRDIMIEEVLAGARFPCVNRDHGCEERFMFNHVKEHEEFCQYQVIDCPDTGKCKWRGTGHNIAAHFKETHAEHFIHSNLSFSTGLIVNEQCNYLAEISSDVESINVPILIQYCCNGDFLYLDVMYFRDGFIKDIFYELTLTNALDKSLSMKLQKARCDAYIVGETIKQTFTRKISTIYLLQKSTVVCFKFTFEAKFLQLRKIKPACLKCCIHHLESGDSPCGKDVCQKCCLNK